jgi:hypothetical protein
MKHQEAKRLIVREWDRWIQTQPIDANCASVRDSLKFFVELQDTRPAFLDFRSRGRDKWRIVHGWLLSERRVAVEIGRPKPPRTKLAKPPLDHAPSQDRPR